MSGERLRMRLCRFHSNDKEGQRPVQTTNDGTCREAASQYTHNP